MSKAKKGKAGKLIGAKNHQAKALTIDGRKYPTIISAAKALGLHSATIKRRIKAGWHGYYFIQKTGGQVNERT